MNRLYYLVIIAIFFASPANSQDVGIKFNEMKIGTTLVTEFLGKKPFRLSEKYLGKRGNNFVTEVIRITNKGKSVFSSTSFYDTKGRLVRRDRSEGFEEYTPYSCFYVVGECRHGYQYPNPFKNNKQTKNSGKYINRLENDTLIVTWKTISDSIVEIPYKLGPYNLRISSNYKNALGQQRGHKLIELIEPTANLGSELAPDKSKSQVKNNSTTPKDDMPLDCKALYETLKTKAPGDVSTCEPVLKKPKFKQCKTPTNHSAGRPTSHVVLVLDASGSMAGKLGGETKMRAAKREATRFLTALEKDVPIGLVVYGHRGDNTDAGKAESCNAIEWAQKVSPVRGRVKASIKALKPVGWTPLAGALDYLITELSGLQFKPNDKISAPVVYVISDGKETCGGDPVASARALHESGVQAAVNIIGFAVDDETRAQLEAISEAGGGKYFPAKDSKALRKQLDAVRKSEAELARYNYCAALNVGAAVVVYHNATNEMTGCFLRESEKKRLNLIYKWIKEFNTPEEKACTAEVKQMAYRDNLIDGKWLIKTTRKMQAQSDAAVEAAKARWALGLSKTKKLMLLRLRLVSSARSNGMCHQLISLLRYWLRCSMQPVQPSACRRVCSEVSKTPCIRSILVPVPDSANFTLTRVSLPSKTATIQV